MNQRNVFAIILSISFLYMGFQHSSTASDREAMLPIKDPSFKTKSVSNTFQILPDHVTNFVFDNLSFKDFLKLRATDKSSKKIIEQFLGSLNLGINEYIQTNDLGILKDRGSLRFHNKKLPLPKKSYNQWTLFQKQICPLVTINLETYNDFLNLEHTLRKEDFPLFTSLSFNYQSLSLNNEHRLIQLIQSGKLPNLISLKFNQTNETYEYFTTTLIEAFKKKGRSRLISLGFDSFPNNSDSILGLTQAIQEDVFPNFSHIDFSKNELTETCATSLTQAIRFKKLLHLISLNLNGVEIENTKLLPLIKSIQKDNLPNLKHLYLSDNNFNNTCIEALTQEIKSGNLSHLISLKLHNTRIKNKEMLSLIQSIQMGNLPNLSCLSLSQNKLDARCINTLAQGIQSKKISRLKRLNLSHIEIQNEEMLPLIQSIEEGGLCHLNSLNLSWNTLGPRCTEALSSAIRSKKLWYLTHLNLNYAYINFSQMNMIFQSIEMGGLPHLTKLKIYNFKIDSYNIDRFKKKSPRVKVWH